MAVHGIQPLINSEKQDLVQDELGSGMIISKRENHTHRTYNKQKM